MGKYFQVEVKPTIPVAALSSGNIVSSDIICDWFGFDIPKGSARLIGLTVRRAGKDGVGLSGSNTPDMELFYAKSINNIPPASLGTPGAAVSTVFGSFGNIVGKAYIEGVSTSNDLDLRVGNIISAGAIASGSYAEDQKVESSNNGLILSGEPNSGANVGFERLYVAIIAKGTHNWGPPAMTVNGTMATTSPVLTVADVDALRALSVSDILRDEDDNLFGTVKSIDSATQVTLESNLASASANDKLVYNTTPISLVLSFEQ